MRPDAGPRSPGRARPREEPRVDTNEKRQGGNARAAIQNADDVFVSAAAVWEIVIKTAIGKLRASRQAADAVADAGFRELPITFEHAGVGRLPLHHGDPFDRLILAVATVESFTIVSSDQRFARYRVPLIDARA